MFRFAWWGSGGLSGGGDPSGATIIIRVSEGNFPESEILKHQ